MDYTPFFEQYLSLREKTDLVFNAVAEKFPDCVKCKIGCSDCCYALFDLSFIEALFINQQFNLSFKGAHKEALLEKANRADRQIYKIKRRAHKDFESGKSESEILESIAAIKVMCPMLGEDNRCEIYEFRPITCRLYGVPTAIEGKAHTCGLSGFRQGKSYPTAHLDPIHQRLYQISLDLTGALNSRYQGLARMLVPLSMAIITEYNDEYLGVVPARKDE